jgi:hypothetical protein
MPEKAVAASAAERPYRPSATIQDIMDSMVDPSADYIWDSVKTIVDIKGTHDFQPSSDAQWLEVRRRAIILSEVANLLAVPGRRVSNREKTYDGNVLNVGEIQKRVDSNHAALVGFASNLRDVSGQLVAAADKKDPAAIFGLGQTLDGVCEACHVVFWYPEERR